MIPTELKQLRERFCKDTSAPIQVYESPYFEDRLALFEDDFKCSTNYDELLNLLNTTYSGDINEFLKGCKDIRNEVIAYCSSCDGYKEFITCDMDKYKADFPVGQVNVYTEEQAKEFANRFVSFDLKKANFQALKYIDSAIVKNADTYEDFINNFTDSAYIKSSKYLRQVMFGNLCPARVMRVEKYILRIIYDFLRKYFESWGEPLSVNSDEIIWKLHDTEFLDLESENINHLMKVFKDEFGFDVRITKYKLHLHQFTHAVSNAKLDVFEKDSFSSFVKSSLACVPVIYAPQVYKLLKGNKVTENDLVFYNNHELARFINPLVLNQEQEEKVKKNKYQDDLPF